MIPALFFARFSFRRFLPRALLGLVLGALSIVAYLPEPSEQIRFVRGELPEVFTFLGFMGDSSLPFFALSILYGFLLLLIESVLSASTARDMAVEPLYDGRMAHLLSSSHKKASLVFTTYLAVQSATFLFVVSLLLGQVIPALLLFPSANLPALLRLNLGFLAVSLLASSLCVLLAFFTKSQKGYQKVSRFLLFLMLLFLLLSRLQGVTGLLKNLTFWSLFDGPLLIFGGKGLLLSLYAFVLSLLCLPLSIFHFSNRES